MCAPDREEPEIADARASSEVAIGQREGGKKHRVGHVGEVGEVVLKWRHVRELWRRAEVEREELELGAEVSEVDEETGECLEVEAQQLLIGLDLYL